MKGIVQGATALHQPPQCTSPPPLSCTYSNILCERTIQTFWSFTALFFICTRYLWHLKEPKQQLMTYITSWLRSLSLYYCWGENPGSDVTFSTSFCTHRCCNNRIQAVCISPCVLLPWLLLLVNRFSDVEGYFITTRHCCNTLLWTKVSVIFRLFFFFFFSSFCISDIWSNKVHHGCLCNKTNLGIWWNYH